MRALVDIESLITAARTRLTNGRDSRLTVEQIYEYLLRQRKCHTPTYKGYRDGELLRKLPPSWSRRSHDDRVAAEVRSAIETSLGDHAQPALALPARAPDSVGKPREAASPGNYRHVIVDEAQDLTLDDWLMLRRLNSGRGLDDSGRLSSTSSGQDTEELGGCPKGASIPRRYAPPWLQRGYRSTTPILTLPADCCRPVQSSLSHCAPTGLAP